MKKIIPIIVYLLGWIYPLSANVYVYIDGFFGIKNDPIIFEFNQNWIAGILFSALAFSIMTFVIYFIANLIFCKREEVFYLTLLNLPLYLVSFIPPYRYVMPILPALGILASMAIVVVTVYVSLKRTEIKVK